MLLPSIIISTAGLTLLSNHASSFPSPGHMAPCHHSRHSNVQTPPLFTDKKAIAPGVQEEEATTDFFIPKDESVLTRNPYKRFVKPLLTSPFASSERASLHDDALESSGGVWQSFFISGVGYAVTGHQSKIIRQLSQAEARGDLQNDWPDYFIDLLGRDSLLAAADLRANDGSFFIAKKVLNDALSTRSVLERSLPGIRREIERISSHWEDVANSSSADESTTVFVDDVSRATFNIIINAIFGSETLNTEEKEYLKQCTDHVRKGLLAIPITNPIINKLPFFRRYRRAMNAREQMKTLVEKKIAEKRIQLVKSNDSDESPATAEPSGILDDLILRMDSSSAALSEEKIVNFCVDNTILSIVAGFDTTASVMTNMMLILHKDNENALLRVRRELESFDISSVLQKNQLEVFNSLPLLKSVALEATRYRPAVSSSFRKTTAPVVVGHVTIPANNTVVMDNVYGSLSNKLYDAPNRVCPLRFVRDSEDDAPLEDEPQPHMFGYGKHMCPGQFLAQVEIALLSKEFLCNFDYDLVEGQNLKPTLPSNIPKSGLVMKLIRRR